MRHDRIPDFLLALGIIPFVFLWAWFLFSMYATAYSAKPVTNELCLIDDVAYKVTTGEVSIKPDCRTFYIYVGDINVQGYDKVIVSSDNRIVRLVD